MRGALFAAALFFSACNPVPDNRKEEIHEVEFEDSCAKGQYLAYRDLEKRELKYYLFADVFHTDIGDSIERKCRLKFVHFQTCRWDRTKTCYNLVGDSIVLSIMGISLFDLYARDQKIYYGRSK